MDAVEPFLDGAAQAGALFAKANGEFIADRDAVALDVPVEDEVARAREGQGPSLDFAQCPDGHLPFREGVLNRREAQEHDNEDEAACHGGLGDIVADLTRNHQPRIEEQRDEDDPGGHQQHGAIVAAQGQKQDEEEARDAEQRQHEARDRGGDGRLVEGEEEEREEERGEAQREMNEAQMPAVQVEVDEQESGQRRRYARFGRGAQGRNAGGRQPEDAAHEPEIDEEIGQHRPGEGGRRRKHAAALDHEHDAEKDRGQRGHAQHDTAEQGEGIDVVAIGIGLPEIELGRLPEASSATRVTVAPGSRVTSKTSDSGSASRTGRMPALGVTAVIRSAPRSGWKTPEPGRRKKGATRRRSICWSLSLRRAKMAKLGLVCGSLARTSMRRIMPSASGAVDNCTLPP